MWDFLKRFARQIALAVALQLTKAAEQKLTGQGDEKPTA